LPTQIEYSNSACIFERGIDTHKIVGITVIVVAVVIIIVIAVVVIIVVVAVKIILITTFVLVVVIILCQYKVAAKSERDKEE
jgi:uncharacterized membrane protein